LDFLEEIELLKPDIFFVNADGHTLAKENLCKSLGIEYIVSKRIPHGNLPPRSTTSLRKQCNIPYRIDLAGGWLDQPFVNKHSSGSVLTICVEPDYEFNDRSGMLIFLMEIEKNWLKCCFVLKILPERNM